MSHNLILWHIDNLKISNQNKDDITYGFEKLSEKIKNEKCSNQLLLISGDIFYEKDLDYFNALILNLKNLKNIKIITNSKENLSLIHNIKICEPNFSFDISSDHYISSPNPKKLNVSLEAKEDMQKEIFLKTNSFIQHNKADTLDKGCTKWKIDTVNLTFKSKFIRLKLLNAYLIIGIIKNKIIYPEFSAENIKYVEVRHLACQYEQLESFKADIYRKYAKIDNIVEVNNNYFSSSNTGATQEVDLKPKSFYNLLVNELSEIKNKDEILKIHLEYFPKNQDTEPNKTTRNLWTINYLSWSNLFCYGSDNNLDFNKLSGINSLIGKNKTGKSSIINIIIFMLYNITPGSKKKVINNSNKDYEAEISFSTFSEIFETKYLVKKIGNAYKQNVKLLKLEDDKWILLESDVINTYQRLNQIIGKYEEITRVNICLQNDQFITDIDSNSIFNKYFGLDQFQKVEELISLKLRDLKRDLKNFKIYQKPDIMNIHSDKSIDELMTFVDNRLKLINNKKIEYEQKVKNIRLEKDQLNKKIHPIKINSDEIFARLKKISSLDDPLDENFQINIEENLIKMEKLLNHEPNISYKKLKECPDKVEKPKNIDVNKKLIEKKELEQKISVSNLKFNDTCSECLHNKTILIDIDAENKLKTINAELKNFKDYQIFIENKKILDEISEDNKAINLEIDKMKFYNYKQKLLYSRDLFNNNKKIDKTLTEKDQQLEETEDDLQKILGSEKKFEKYKIELANYQNIDSKINETTKNLENYHLYKSKINYKTGLPHQIMLDSCSWLERSVNMILSDITDFRITFKFKTNNKNSGQKSDKFKISIVNSVMKTEHIDAIQGSGSQKFIIDLAIRLAIANSYESNLQGADFFIIDEGFGCMDKDHLENTRLFLEKLNNRHKFKWMIIISHIEFLQSNTFSNILKISRIDDKSRIYTNQPPKNNTENAINEIPKIKKVSFSTESESESKTETTEIFILKDNKIYCNLCEGNIRGDKITHSKTQRHLNSKKNLKKSKLESIN